MTLRKTKRQEPFGSNAASGGLMGFEETLIALISKYFKNEALYIQGPDDEYRASNNQDLQHETPDLNKNHDYDKKYNVVKSDSFIEIIKNVNQAVSTYAIEIQTNPLRKISAWERHDHQELIACIKELRNRLDPIYIPSPLLNSAQNAYRPCSYGEPTLKEEIKDLLLRLRNLQQLFEGIENPFSTQTNPGKPEQRRLEMKLEKIYESFSEYSLVSKNAPKSTRNDFRGAFVHDILIVFNIAKPRKSTK